MSEEEAISTPFDCAAKWGSLRGRGQDKHDGFRQPALWAENRVVHQPDSCAGQYPRGFVLRQLARWRVNPRECLHVCSGALNERTAYGGVRVDIRVSQRPTVRADGRALPFRNRSFAAVFIDPPYSTEYAEALYCTDYPRPTHLLKEAARVVRPGGIIGMLHFLVPHPVPGTSIADIVGVTQGTRYRIRAWTVFRRDAATLFSEERP